MHLIDPAKSNFKDYVEPFKNKKGKTEYRIIKDFSYKCYRYNKLIHVKTTDAPYDGATGAKDIKSFSWVIHDVLCRDAVFADGSECSNWQASTILSDILKAENRWFRARYWFIGTFLLGGKKLSKF